MTRSLSVADITNTFDSPTMSNENNHSIFTTATSLPPITDRLNLPNMVMVSSSIDDNNNGAIHNRGKLEKIPRPKNAFILFRQHYHKELIDEWTKAGTDIPHNSEISKILGVKWKNISENEKTHWSDLAKEEKLEHLKKYPQYKYKPTRRKPRKVPKKLKHATPWGFQKLSNFQQQQHQQQEMIQPNYVRTDMNGFYQHQQHQQPQQHINQFPSYEASGFQNPNMTLINKQVPSVPRILQPNALPRDASYHPSPPLHSQNIMYQQPNGPIPSYSMVVHNSSRNQQPYMQQGSQSNICLLYTSRCV